MCHHLLRSLGLLQRTMPVPGSPVPGQLGRSWLPKDTSCSIPCSSSSMLLNVGISRCIYICHLCCRFGASFSSSWSPLRGHLYGSCSPYLHFKKWICVVELGTCQFCLHTKAAENTSEMSALQAWILQQNHIAWLLIIQHTNATELNLSKIVESDILREKIFSRSQQCRWQFLLKQKYRGCHGDNCVLSTLLSSHLLFIVWVFFP